MLMDRDSFADRNVVGKNGERLATLFLKKRGNKVQNVSDLPEFQKKEIDIIIKNKKNKLIKIEVKTDEKAFQTGNLFIEIKNNKNIGWIFSSEADFFFFIIPQEKMIISMNVYYFRKWFIENEKNYKTAKSKTTSITGELWYEGYGKLIKINDLKKQNFVKIFKKI